MLALQNPRKVPGTNPSTKGTFWYEIAPMAGHESQAIDMADATLVLTRSGTPAGTFLIADVLLVNPNSTGAFEILKLPPVADCEGLLLTIFNTGAADIQVQDTAGTALFTILPGGVAQVQTAGTVWASNVGAANAVLMTADLQLTNAQMLALNATPINLIAAPGANKAIVVVRAYVVSDTAAGAYTEAAGQDVALEYASGADILVIDNTGFFTSGSVLFRTFTPTETAITGFTPVVNSAVRLFKTVAEFGGGNAANTVSVRLHFMIVDTVAFK